MRRAVRRAARGAMTCFNISILIVRGLALFQFLQIWPTLWMAMTMIHAEVPLEMKMAYYAIPFLYKFLCIFLWLCAPWMAKKMTQGISEEPQKKFDISFDEIFVISTVAVGLLVLSKGIPSITRFFYLLIELAVDRGINQPLSWDHTLLPHLNGALYLILAIFLIFTPSGFLRLIKAARVCGQNHGKAS